MVTVPGKGEDLLSQDAQKVTGEVIRSPLFADEELRPLICAFVNGLQNRVSEMREAIQSSDYKLLAKISHKLKGTAGNYGLPVLAAQVGILEDTARIFETDQRLILKLITDVENICERVRFGLMDDISRHVKPV